MIISRRNEEYFITYLLEGTEVQRSVAYPRPYQYVIVRCRWPVPYTWYVFDKWQLSNLILPPQFILWLLLFDHCLWWQHSILKAGSSLSSLCCWMATAWCLASQQVNSSLFIGSLWPLVYILNSLYPPSIINPVHACIIWIYKFPGA